MSSKNGWMNLSFWGLLCLDPEIPGGILSFIPGAFIREVFIREAFIQGAFTRGRSRITDPRFPTSHFFNLLELGHILFDIAKQGRCS
ncbi:hypothetical protein Trco_007144 [Trichoderma cornu-damae]|uniref:Uncharacterized protein n=1 Tax=Trichoderma cornu-damae TaxID=654480 RepID=A0A9P8TUX3_9HYPO|nr:hypothetical protein Trco_007144 [Trichoderma cornu-damae]